MIFTKPETGEMVVKVRQQARADGHRPLPFKLQIKGALPLENLRHFRGGKSKGGRGRATSRARS